jgi:hypothetical protein
MQVLLALMLAALPARADDVVITQVADIYPKLPPEGAKAWDPAPLVQGIYASPFEFTPKHVYELIDASVRPEVIQAVAARAALFYDPGALPLGTLAANARLGQAKQTLTLDERSFAILFESYRVVIYGQPDGPPHAPDWLPLLALLGASVLLLAIGAFVFKRLEPTYARSSSPWPSHPRHPSPPPAPSFARSPPHPPGASASAGSKGEGRRPI